MQRLGRRYATELALRPPGAPDAAWIVATHDRLATHHPDPGARLRVLRQCLLERLAQLDCRGELPLQAVTAVMTQLAEFALDQALALAAQELTAQHGLPRRSDGAPAQLWVVGMGKLGARELNVSSDIDLVYVYDQDGETPGDATGRQRISHHEFFTRAVRRVQALLGETTEHGQVFRIDLALRPNGHSGPMVVSLNALEEYFQVQGREWERFAWLKSRVVAPAHAIADGGAAALRQAVLPFVFRRYLDYGVFEALRDLHRQIREHAQRRSAGRPERSNDVKLSRGGIREIEFIVQLLQVVRGGQYPELRTRATLDAMPRLVAAGLMTPQRGQALAQAYTFLRRVEHRIQYLDDQQTHVLPTADSDLDWIAATLGLAGSSALLCELNHHRETVAQEFDALLGGAAKEERGCRNGACGGAAAAGDWSALAEHGPPEVVQHLEQWRQHPRVLALRDEARQRLLRVLQRALQTLADGAVSQAAVLRLLDWLQTLLRRENYLALLVERPAVLLRLLRLLDAARWTARYLTQHPGVIDELAAGDMLAGRFDAPEFRADLERRRESLRITAEDDDEALLNLLRRAQHGEVFRTLARDLEGRMGVEAVADDLSALADAVLDVTVRWCWPRLRRHHRQQPRLAILGYGKLGGKELGYGSDLDLVFVYDDEDDDAPEVYAAFARKLINWLTVKTSEGDLYEIDTELRPNGSSGLLVTRFQAFAEYQLGRGSNTAWTWEHQAMTRARCVFGDADLRARFDAVREAVLTAARDPAALRSEILAMRSRVARARPVPAELFDLKHSPGGMVDAEFAVQHLVLRHSGAHPELRPNIGNIALMLRAEGAGLLPPGVGRAAADAYRALRHAQHRARLDEQPTQVSPQQFAQARAAVQALWQAVFGSD